MTASTYRTSSILSRSLLNLTFFIFLLFSLISGTHAAFTAPVERNGDYVDRNSEGDWCFYPSALDPTSIDVACAGPVKGDFQRVLAAHLNTTTSINYFSSSLDVLGGPEWPVNAAGANRKIYLCVSGRAGDYTYQTMCTTVGKDNSLGNGGPSPYCKVQVGQTRVTDGCYIPNQEVPEPSVIGTSTRRPAVVTITRASSSGRAAQTSLVRDQPANSASQIGSGMRHTAAVWSSISISLLFVLLL